MDKETACLLQSIQSAGEAIALLQNASLQINYKQNNDIVTQADIAANDILKSAITKTFPEDGWLSEECADTAVRLQHDRVWIVDPIDGTKEYAKGLPEYAISVALVENGIPCLAAVFNPATDQLFHAIRGQGAWLNGERIFCRTQASARMLLLASRSEYKRGEWQFFEKEHEVRVIGSIAYKLALIAAGFADATFSLGPKNEWDIAAGVLLVQEAGGKVTDQYQKPFLFNQPTVLVSGIVACASSVQDQLFELIEASQ